MPWTVLLYSLVVVIFRQSTCIPNSQNNQELGKNITKILDSFFDSGKYDRRVRPNYGTPVEVGVTLHILTISSVSEVQMDFTTDFYFRQVWTDSRLQFTETERIKELSVGAEVADKIWVPDTFFANEKQAYFHEATTMNTFLRIGSKGKVYRSIRLTVTANCPMDLQYFPMDRQKCTIEIESYGYSMSDIIYFWKDGEKSIGIDEGLTLPQFAVAGVKQKDKKVVLSTGNYSRLLCEIQLIRSMGYYMIQIYVPASLIVMISWVSFWLHRNATPARVQLGVVTVLTMTTLMSSTNSQLPKISYVKSIDVFLGTCFVMVFAALIEYAAVGYIGKRISMRKNKYQQNAKEDKRHRKFGIDANTFSNELDQHHFQIIPSVPSNPANNINAQIDHNGNYNQSSGGDGAQQLVMPPVHHQYVQLSSNNNLLSTTQPSFTAAQTGQLPTSSSAHSHHPVAHYATIRRNVLERASSLGCTGNATPRLIHRPQEVRLEMIGSKALTAVAQSSEQDNLCSSNTNLNSGSLRKNCTQSSANLVGQHLIQRNVPGVMTAGLNAGVASAPHFHTHHLPTTSTTNMPTPQHLDSHPLTRTIATSTPGRKIHPNLPSPPKNITSIFGVSPSDIDKYSRVVFPVCFVCFNLMYWIIFMHISNLLEFDFEIEDS